MKLVKNEKGSVLPFVALFIFFVGIGFVALIIDGGILFNAQRDMMTAADAGALAGALEMEKKIGYEVNSTDIERAKEIAEMYAIENGATRAKAEYLEDYVIEEMAPRDVIRVVAEVDENSYFSRIFGYDGSTVYKEAIATWGVVRKITGGQILPLFITEEAYDAQDIDLHDGKVIINDAISNPNRELVRLTGLQGNNDITKVLNGENINQEFVINTVLLTEPGAGSIENAIELRMQRAISYEEDGITKYRDEEERRAFMSGLLPIVTTEDTKGKLELTIKYFLVYTIYDVIDNKNTGSEYGFSDPEFVSDGISIEYEEPYDKATLIGEISGEKIYLNEIVTDGDQELTEEEEENIDGLATYTKLVK